MRRSSFVFGTCFTGRDRLIAERMYKVAPMKASKEQKGFVDGSSKQVLRPAGSEERNELKSRIMKASDHFFITCKIAVADYMSNTSRRADKSSRMFFRIVLAFEQFYSSLAQPLPLPCVRKWDVVKSELVSRKTFLLRFPRQPEKMDDTFVALVSTLPLEKDRESHVGKLLEHLQNDVVVSSRIDHGGSTSLVNDWLEHEDELALFQRLDSDGDGLVSVQDLNVLDQRDAFTDKEREFIADFMKTEVFEGRDTYTFAEFLEADPNVAQQRKLHRVSSMMFKGHRPDTT